MTLRVTGEGLRSGGPSEPLSPARGAVTREGRGHTGKGSFQGQPGEGPSNQLKIDLGLPYAPAPAFRFADGVC